MKPGFSNPAEARKEIEKKGRPDDEVDLRKNHGKYRLRVKDITVRDLENAEVDKDFYSVRFDVLDTDAEGVSSGDTAYITWVKGKFASYFFRDIKSFVAGVLGVAANDINMDHVEGSYLDPQQPEEDQIFIGAEVDLNSYLDSRVNAAGEEKEFTSLKWQAVS